jgi:addiction module RelE/StbE family toxin
MADPEKRDQAPPSRNDEDWPLAPGFAASWKRHKTRPVSGAMTTFDRCKRAIPPQPLPAGMKDHNLKGPLKGFRECHLDANSLLIYKPVDNGAIKLFRVCTHDELSGPRAEALAKQFKKSK